MEAILGASFCTGGIDMALKAGDALGLTFGGCMVGEFYFFQYQLFAHNS